MKYIIFLLVIVFTSCNNMEDVENEVLGSTKSNEITVTTRSAGDGKMDLLGYGYNCLYSIGDSYKGGLNAVIDIERYVSGDARDPLTGEKVTGMPKGKIEESLSHGDFSQKEVYGSSLDDFYRKVSSKYTLNTGSWIKWGSLEFKLDFDNTITQKDKYSFYKVDLCINTKRLFFNTFNVKRLKYFLSDDFLFALKYYTAKEIVDDYGTHVLTDVYVGGKLSILASALETDKTKDDLIKLTTDFASRIITSNTVDLKVSQNLVNTSLSVIQSGGNKYIQNKIIRSENGMISTNVINWDEWANSVDVDHSTLIRSGVDHLIPIWEFIDDPKLKEEVISEINARNSQQEMPLFDYTSYPSFTLTTTDATQRGSWDTRNIINRNNIVNLSQDGTYTIKFSKISGTYNYFINHTHEMACRYNWLGGIIRLDSLTINGSSFYVEMPKNKTLIGVHFDRDYGRTGKPDGYSYFVSEYEDEITVRDNKNNRIVKIPVKINFQ